MAVVFHTIDSLGDLDRISDFLIRHYQPDNRDGNWLFPVWEYSYTHPGFNPDDRYRIGIWEESGEIVGATLIETLRNDIALCTHPQYGHLKVEMLDYAESELFLTDERGRKVLHVFAQESDADQGKLMESWGYEHEQDLDRPLASVPVERVFPDGFEEPHLPQGYKFKSLKEEPDIGKMNRVLYRGFNHSGEPKDEDLEGRRRMISGPRFKPELTTVIEAPDGNWITYCGMWYDGANKLGYVEPVCTDPEFRKKGLGTATVIEGIRKCALKGAEIAYVFNDLSFYLSIGFSVVNTYFCWTKKY